MHTASIAPTAAPDGHKLVLGFAGDQPEPCHHRRRRQARIPAAAERKARRARRAASQDRFGTDNSVPVAAEKPPEPAAKPRSGGWMIQVGAFPEENGSQATSGRGAGQGEAPARPGRPVHRTRGEGRQIALSRALCRPGQRPGRNRLQASQAQRNSLHAAEELTTDVDAPDHERAQIKANDNGMCQEPGAADGVVAYGVPQRWRREKNFLGLVDASGQIRRPALVGMEFLHQRAMRTA